MNLMISDRPRGVVRKEGCINSQLIPSRAFGYVERLIGKIKQRIEVNATRGLEFGDAQAERQRTIAPGCGDCLGSHLLSQTFCNLLAPNAITPGQQNHKFVSPIASEEFILAQTFTHSLCRLN